MDRDGFLGTFSGLRFWPLDPEPEKILIADIAHALAHQCRFGGHASKFYSVSENSVHVSRRCAPEDALWGLLHDASEAYLVELPRVEAIAGRSRRTGTQNASYSGRSRCDSDSRRSNRPA
jgi:hypothetical protein